jgi:hypothetical protein
MIVTKRTRLPKPQTSQSLTSSEKKLENQENEKVAPKSNFGK